MSACVCTVYKATESYHVKKGNTLVGFFVVVELSFEILAEVLLVSPELGAKLIDMWTDFGANLLLSIKSTTDFLLF